MFYIKDRLREPTTTTYNVVEVQRTTTITIHFIAAIIIILVMVIIIEEGMEVEVVHFTSFREEQGKKIATFCWTDFPMLDRNGSLKVADLFTVDIDLTCQIILLCLRKLIQANPCM